MKELKPLKFDELTMEQKKALKKAADKDDRQMVKVFEKWETV